jgi:hypothetical protein
MTTTKTVTDDCGKCNGKGKLSWTRVANGVCFVCQGSGKLVADESEVLAARWSRSHVIHVIKCSLDRMTAYGEVTSDELDQIGTSLAHADADVHARAMAALARLGAREHDLYLLARAERDERATLIAGVRRVVTNVRAA